MEEIGAEAAVGRFIGVVENAFTQHGKPHAEINLVYEFDMDVESVCAKENWIEFEWRDIGGLADANLLPEAFRRLESWPNVEFRC